MDFLTSRAAIKETIAQTPKPATPAPVPPPVQTPPAEPPAPVVVVEAPKPPKPVKLPRAAKPAVPPPVKAAPARKPVAKQPSLKPVEEAPKAPAALPGIKAAAQDLWIGRQSDAIDLVLAQPLTGGKRTVGGQAKAMLAQMHEKELLHAADSGERLYLPDKMSWTSLREEGPVYRVYLNFAAWQANGERIQARSYQFRADLEKRSVSTDDNATRQDFFDSTDPLNHKASAVAEDIENLLSAVDLVNKQKMRAIIVRKSRSTKGEQKNMDSSLAAAQGKFKRSVIYFRTKHPEAMLQNIGKAYQFSALLKT
jgi:hypothetical protein